MGLDRKRIRSGISSNIISELTDCNAALSQQRKKRQIPSTLAPFDAVERLTQLSHPLHRTNKPGILSLDIQYFKPRRLDRLPPTACPPSYSLDRLKQPPHEDARIDLTASLPKNVVTAAEATTEKFEFMKMLGLTLYTSLCWILGTTSLFDISGRLPCCHVKHLICRVPQCMCSYSSVHHICYSKFGCTRVFGT